MKICSLLPSSTEIVFSLGLGDHLVAITHECDFPPEVSLLPRVTRSTLVSEEESSRQIDTHIRRSLHQGSSIYDLDQEQLEKANPDLVLTQELCDVCAVSYRQVERSVRTLPGSRNILSLEPVDLEGILDTIHQVAIQTHVPERGRAVVAGLRERIDALRQGASATAARPRVFAWEWLDPPFSGGHWVPEMIELAGGRDELGQTRRPSTGISWDSILDYDPEVVILMPCGFETERTLQEYRRLQLPAAWIDLAAVRHEQIYAVNGSAYFNRPGPRIVDGLEILGEILHPERFPRKSPPGAWRKLSESAPPP